MNLKEKKKFQVEQMMREGICGAVSRLMRQISYKDMKVEDIAKEAGVSKGTLYNYFSSKEELVKHFLDEKTALYEKAVDNLMASKISSAREKMSKYLELIFSFSDDNEGWAKLFFEYIQEHASLETERNLCLTRLHKRHLEIIQQGIDNEGWKIKMPDVKAWLLALLVMKVNYMLVVDKDNCPPKNDIIEALLDGLNSNINGTLESFSNI